MLHLKIAEDRQLRASPLSYHLLSETSINCSSHYQLKTPTFPRNTTLIHSICQPLFSLNLNITNQNSYSVLLAHYRNMCGAFITVTNSISHYPLINITSWFKAKFNLTLLTVN